MTFLLAGEGCVFMAKVPDRAATRSESTRTRRHLDA
jgi:hypothetical protein